MPKRLHMTENGPKPCDAKSIETCRADPIDGMPAEHFDDPQAANAAWEKMNEAKNQSPKLTKSSKISSTLRKDERGAYVYNNDQAQIYVLGTVARIRMKNSNGELVEDKYLPDVRFHDGAYSEEGFKVDNVSEGALTVDQAREKARAYRYAAGVAKALNESYVKDQGHRSVTFNDTKLQKGLNKAKYELAANKRVSSEFGETVVNPPISTTSYIANNSTILQKKGRIGNTEVTLETDSPERGYIRAHVWDSAKVFEQDVQWNPYDDRVEVVNWGTAAVTPEDANKIADSLDEMASVSKKLESEISKFSKESAKLLKN